MAEDATELPFFLVGDSAQARLIRAFDWTGTPLGHPSSWSPALQSMVQLILASRQPMFVAWGPEQTFIYNDAYIPIMGRKHPMKLGLPSAQVWSEAWPLLQPMFDRVFDGEPVHQTGFLVPIDRNGTIEDAYFNFSYTPMVGSVFKQAAAKVARLARPDSEAISGNRAGKTIDAVAGGKPGSQQSLKVRPRPGENPERGSSRVDGA